MATEEIKPGYLRVTAMLSPFSGLSLVPEHILENAKSRGTLVHQMILAHELGLGEISPNIDINGYMQSYHQWATGKNFLPIVNRFYDDDLMITGEIDAMYEYEDGVVIIDYKTPSKESKSWPIQATGYSYLAKKAGYNVKAVEFVKLNKEGNYPTVYCYTENMDLFTKILDTYRYFFGNKNKDDFLDN